MTPAAWQVQTVNSKAFFGDVCEFSLKPEKPRSVSAGSNLTNRTNLALNSPDLEDFKVDILQI